MKDFEFETSPEDWESRKLGASLEHADVVTAELMKEAMDSLNLQMISIRLQKSLIEDLKLIAKANGVGYQPLMRDVLRRFVECEKKQIMRDYLEKALEDKKKEEKESKGKSEAQPKAA